MRCITLVRFPKPTGLSGARLRAVLEDAVPRYQKIPDLHRKCFLGNDTHGGGVYEWESREAAQAFYKDRRLTRRLFTQLSQSIAQTATRDLHRPAAGRTP
jgi:hypothetical protein